MDNVVRSFKDAALEAASFNVVVVRDSIEVVGGPQVCLHLLQELHNVVKKERAQARGVVLLALEQAPEEYSHLQSNGSPASGGKSIQTLDCFSDPLGWNEVSSPSKFPKDATRAADQANRKTSGFGVEAASSRGDDVTAVVINGDADVSTGDVTTHMDVGMQRGSGDASSLKVRFGDEGSLEGLKEGIQTAGEAMLGGAMSGRLALVLDSMSTLLQYCSATKVLAFLEWLRWSGRISTVLMLLHADLHDSKTNAAFERLASTVVDVQARPRLEERGTANGRVHFRHKTRKGKVRHEHEQFWLEPSGVRFGPIERTASVSELVAKESTNMQSGRALPAAKPAASPEVPFNLELSEAERLSRARVVLPYEHQGDGQEVKIYDGRPSKRAGHVKVRREGRIGYESEVESGAAAEAADANAEGPRGHILYTRDSDEEPPDSDEDPDDDLDI